MVSTFNPDLAARLVRETREDDEQATRAPWTTVRTPGFPINESALYTVSDEDYGQIAECFDRTPLMRTDKQCAANAAAIARLRNNAGALAAQLEAACAEVDRLQAENEPLRREVEAFAGYDKELAMVGEQTGKIVSALEFERDDAREQLRVAQVVRDDARAVAQSRLDEFRALRAEVERMRPVFVAAKAWHPWFTAGLLASLQAATNPNGVLVRAIDAALVAEKKGQP